MSQTFACKKCKKCFRKDVETFEDWSESGDQSYHRGGKLTQMSSDEYCPHCDNHYVLEAVTPTPALQVEGEDARVDARMLKDGRMRSAPERRMFGVQDAADRLG